MATALRSYLRYRAFEGDRVEHLLPVIASPAHWRLAPLPQTLSRAEVEGLPNANEAGGLSGAPVFERSTAVLKKLAGHLKGEVPIIGVGGIMKGEDAVAKLDAGASLVQIYSGFIYRGPELVGEVAKAIAGRNH